MNTCRRFNYDITRPSLNDVIQKKNLDPYLDPYLTPNGAGNDVTAVEKFSEYKNPSPYRSNSYQHPCDQFRESPAGYDFL